MHLYSYGAEVGTNLSEKSTLLSEDQALAILMAGYLNSNRGKTVPAEPIWATAPWSFRAMLDPESMRGQVQLSVDDEGRVTELRHNPNQHMPRLLREVLTKTRFYPALEKGQAVASTRQVDLARLLQ